MRGPMISNDRHKQTPLRDPAPQNQMLLELLEFQIQISGHPLLHNPNTWSLSQLQDFQSSDACLNYVFGLISLMLFGLV